MKKNIDKIQILESISNFDPKLDLEHRKLDVKMASSKIELCKEGFSLLKQITSYLEEKERTKQSEIESLTAIKKSEVELEIQIKKFEGIKITEANLKDNIQNIKFSSECVIKPMNLLLDEFGVEVVLKDELFEKYMNMVDKLIKISNSDKNK